MTGYRDVHRGDGAGHQYDAMHHGRVDSLIWRQFVKPYVSDAMQSAKSADARTYLDFACGTGRVLKVGASVFPDVSGVDISEDMLEVARERVPSATIYCTDVTKNPDVIARTFDCISLFRFLLNAEADLRSEVLAWIAARTKPGAILIVNNHRNSASLTGLIAGMTKPDGRRELNVLSRKDTVVMIEKAGFRIERCAGFRIIPSVNGRAILGDWVQLQGERLCRALGLGYFGTELVFDRASDLGRSRMHDDPAYWDSFAGHALDAAVIDPNDTLGHKNRYIAMLRDAAVVEALEHNRDLPIVLDFGCGTGSLTEALASNGFAVAGVDISMGLLRRSHQRRLGENTTMIRIDGHRLPMKDASVDAAATYIVLMYLTDELLLPLMREISRVLKPGSRFVVMEQFRRRQKMIARDGKLHRSTDRFLRIAENAGFSTQSITVCRYGHFPFLYAIRAGLIPERFFGPLRRLERMIGRAFGVFPWDYCDVRVVLRNSVDYNAV